MKSNRCYLDAARILGDGEPSLAGGFITRCNEHRKLHQDCASAGTTFSGTNHLRLFHTPVHQAHEGFVPIFFRRAGMRNSRPFTSATFTKRVDHDAGRHRTVRAPSEPLVCESCGSVYFKRRWIAYDDVPRNGKQINWPSAKTTTCPACKQTRANTRGGYVHLNGAFLEEHRDEIENLLSNEAERASHDNPMGRIISWERGAQKLIVTTTTEHLAKRLGQALSKAFDGEVNYDFSHENKLARVHWRRD